MEPSEGARRGRGDGARPPVKVVGVKPTGEVVELTGPGDEAGSSSECLVFLGTGDRLEEGMGLVEAFRGDERLGAAGLHREDETGQAMESVCRRPTWLDLVCRLVVGGNSQWGKSSPGLAIAGFAQERVLAVECVHPYAWAVRRRCWEELGGTAGDLDWESGVQELVDRLDARGMEVLFLPGVRVRVGEVGADPWCYPSRDLAALKGMMGYVRRRWGAWRARVFRWGFKPLFLARLVAEMCVRAVCPGRMAGAEGARTLGSARELGRFLAADTVAFLKAG